MNELICPHCGKTIELSDAISQQVEDAVEKGKETQKQQLREQLENDYQSKLNDEVSKAVAKATKAANEKIERLESEKSGKENDAKDLRQQISDLLDKITALTTERDNAKNDAKRELIDNMKKIRDEAYEKATEENQNVVRELRETIERLNNQLNEAKLTASQGSQQLQGEILELDMEQALRSSFPFDTIEEVKKGERGSDIRQTINERHYTGCGLILWECKNAKTYQSGWLSKLKDEMIEEKAQFGVIVFNPTDGEGENYKRLADNVWIVKPKYAIMLASLLREVCVRVAIANRNAEGKDVKTELLYNYLTGGEFANRLRYVVEAYDEMSEQLKTEKKQAMKRWAAQEKILEKATNGLLGLSGDLQGIAGKEIIALPDIDDLSDNEA